MSVSVTCGCTGIRISYAGTSTHTITQNKKVTS